MPADASPDGAATIRCLVSGNDRGRFAHAGVLAIAVAISGCGAPNGTATTPSGNASRGSGAAGGPSAIDASTQPARESTAASLDGYKRDAARRIYFSNRTLLFDGAPPPVLKSLVVLSIRTDAAGKPTRVAVLRSNGYRDLEQRAIRSVHDAAPLPVPRASVLHKGAVEYVETWLFRDDGRFQIRSLAVAQQSVDD